MHGDLCKHLGIDSSTDHPDRYSNLFLNAYINRHVHAEYFSYIFFYRKMGLSKPLYAKEPGYEYNKVCPPIRYLEVPDVW